MNDRMEVVQGDLSVRDGRIAALGNVPDGPHDRVIDAAGDLLLPGLVQTHVHLCQTLFRGLADDLGLMDWLRTRIWPLEAAHSDASLRASARLAACELLRGGTTSILTMETVHDTDVVFDEIARSGMRATIGKCMMDDAANAPARLKENTSTSISDTLTLFDRWHGTHDGRIRVAFAPRFAVSCTRQLLEAVAVLASERAMLVHTHAAESRGEVSLVQKRTGMDNIAYLVATGLASPRLCAAHCVHVDDTAQGLLADFDVKVLHCPSSNMKLGSGLAPIVEMMRRRITVSLGADGAACNNRLDMFDEMRLAGLLQSGRLGPGALAARDIAWMATRGGAKTLGLDDEIGMLEPGKKADLILVGRNAPHAGPMKNPYSALVYSARSSDVRTTMVDGRVLVDEGRLTGLDPDEAVARGREQVRQLTLRARLG